LGPLFLVFSFDLLFLGAMVVVFSIKYGIVNYCFLWFGLFFEKMDGGGLDATVCRI
jgi:hypothetical protein